MAEESTTLETRPWYIHFMLMSQVKQDVIQSHNKCPMFIFEVICYPISTYWHDLDKNITSLMVNLANSAVTLLIEA